MSPRSRLNRVGSRMVAWLTKPTTDSAAAAAGSVVAVVAAEDLDEPVRRKWRYQNSNGNCR